MSTIHRKFQFKRVSLTLQKMKGKRIGEENSRHFTTGRTSRTTCLQAAVYVWPTRGSIPSWFSPRHVSWQGQVTVAGGDWRCQKDNAGPATCRHGIPRISHLPPPSSFPCQNAMGIFGNLTKISLLVSAFLSLSGFLCNTFFFRLLIFFNKTFFFRLLCFCFSFQNP